MIFKEAVRREVAHLAGKHGITDNKAFLIWFGTDVLDLQEEEALEAISVEGANDKGIDFFYVDPETFKILIAQGKYSSGFDYRAKEKDVAQLESSLNWLHSPEALRKEGKPELAEAAEQYIEARQQGYAVELAYVYTGPASRNIENKIVVFNQNQDNVTRSLSFRHFNIGILEALWEEARGTRHRIEQDALNVPEKYLTVRGKFGKALVANVPCSEIVRLYQAHKDLLFARNVRLFLGSKKGSVNAGIASTIKNLNERGNFWAYNNGITIICDDFTEIDDCKVRLVNFSVVNGCQTTVSLAENQGTHPDLMVMVRCVAAAEGIVDDVIRYTNSQNPIRAWDIASQDKAQQRLKREFDKLKKPFIYVTRRGDKPSGSLDRYKDAGTNSHRYCRTSYGCLSRKSGSRLQRKRPYIHPLP